MESPKRTYIFNVSRNPSISGYGGFDEWTIGPLDSEQADVLLQKMDKLISGCAKAFKVEGGWTGVE